MIALVMQQIPPRSGSDRRRNGGLSLRPSSQAQPGEPVSGLFSTGKHGPLEGAPAEAAKRNDRGKRIVSEVRRTVLYAVVFLGVGIILALFASTLWGMKQH